MIAKRKDGLPFFMPGADSMRIVCGELCFFAQAEPAKVMCIKLDLVEKILPIKVPGVICTSISDLSRQIDAVQAIMQSVNW